MTAPILLVTNDDGIESNFLHVLVDALRQAGFDTRVAAPKNEQSWISHAISRRREVHIVDYPDFGCPAWALDGTPADCVNIALAHLLPQRPAAVVSGINLATNVGLPHILSSGTVAGALEGALWSLPAVAFSMELPQNRVQEIRRSLGEVEGSMQVSLLCAATRAAEFVRQRLTQTHRDETPIVHNINFPALTTMVTPVVRTRPANLRIGALFERNNPGSFSFRYLSDFTEDPSHDADHTIINRGCISYSVLDYGLLGGGET